MQIMKLNSVVLLLLVVPLANSWCPWCSPPRKKPKDCSGFQGKSSGVYTIYPAGGKSAVKVYCDLETGGGRWTVFQRRMDGSVNFYRPWKYYKSGFGLASGEYWLGLDNLHNLTSSKSYELRVDMEDFKGNKAFALYDSFSVGDEDSGYVLKVSGFQNGGAGDSLTYHNGMKFSTFDKDNGYRSYNCPKKLLGAFWYNKCQYTNPNGVYSWGTNGTAYISGVTWYYWKGYYSLKKFSMKIRPVK